MKTIFIPILCILLTLTQAQSWSYEDQSTWASIDSCGGSSQSPISIPCDQSVVQCPAKKSYDIIWKNPVLYIRSTSTQDLSRDLNKNEYSVLRFSNQTNDYLYNLQRLHWRQPAQHIINGKTYDLQLHLFYSLDHKSKIDNSVVVILFELDQTLTQDGFDHYNLYDPEFSDQMTLPFHFNNDEAYYYRGSATKPPCAQTHNFFVHAKPHKITTRSLNKFKAAINSGKSNNRLPQRIGDRMVYKIGNQCSGSSSSTAHSM